MCHGYADRAAEGAPRSQRADLLGRLPCRPRTPAFDGFSAVPSPRAPPPMAVDIFPKACADGNAAALDKALDALNAFLPVASEQLAARVAKATTSAIVAKALGARPGACWLLVVRSQLGWRWDEVNALTVASQGAHDAHTCHASALLASKTHALPLPS